MTTIFKQIIEKTVPANIVYEDELSLAFHDILPQAPIHILVVPKKEIAKLSLATAEDQNLLGHLFLVSNKIMREQNITDFRVVINNGSKAGQAVMHLHLHILAGRNFVWPPG